MQILKTSYRQTVVKSVLINMLLDIDIDFDHPRRTYNPGDTIKCKIDVQSTFNLTCKYITVRLVCPYKNKEIEYFRVYETARRRNAALNSDDQWKDKSGAKGMFVCS